MEIKPEQVIEYLGFAEVKTFDEFKEKFESPEGFAKRSFIDKEIGKTLGAATTKIKGYAKEFGIEFEPEEIKDKQVADIYKLTAEKFRSKIEELEGKVSQNNDEQIKALNEELGKVKFSLQQEQTAKKTLQADNEKMKVEFDGKIKKVNYDNEFSKFWGELEKKFVPGIDPLKVKGFKGDLLEQRKYDFDDNNKFFVADAEGNKILSGKKAGEWKTPFEDALELADKAGMLPKNPEAGKPANTFNLGGQNQNQNQNQNNGAPKRQLSPAALKAAGMI